MRARSSCDPSRPRLHITGPTLVASLWAMTLMAHPPYGPLVYTDPANDVAARPMDSGLQLSFDPTQHRLPDLLSITLGAWMPADSVDDLFSGVWLEEGAFARIDLRLRGLINPPGPIEPWNFDPFFYGNHPVYGFVEIDMDDDPDTGGELDAPQYRYLGNAVRFGGQVLRPQHAHRAAQSAAAFDGSFTSAPQVERHGEEFHIALLGTEFAPSGVDVIHGNGDLVFDAGETWALIGRFFHRAHGFEPFSFVKGGHTAGEYAPLCELQFRHDMVTDTTEISLVFPLTNVGAGLMRGEPPQPTNQNPGDHASVLEALEDLQLSAFFLPVMPTGLAEEAIIEGWADRDPAEYLPPTSWRATAILGSSYTEPGSDAILIVWSDIFPNVVLGDVDGSGVFDGRDRQSIAQYIAQRDSADGVIDGAVQISDFAADFSLYDVNYDGVVDAADLVPIQPNPDGDSDGDIDLADFSILQRCFGEVGELESHCLAADLDGDLFVSLNDYEQFLGRMIGPGAP